MNTVIFTSAWEAAQLHVASESVIDERHVVNQLIDNLPIVIKPKRRRRERVRNPRRY